MQSLYHQGYCSSHQAESWRVVNRPLCPIKVQIEVRDAEDGTIDIIPLSTYTETLEERFPLAGLKLPHAQTLPFRTKEDIEVIISFVNQCFPKR